MVRGGLLGPLLSRVPWLVEGRRGEDYFTVVLELKYMKRITLRKTVESKVRKAALKYLLSKRKSKGKDKVYGSTLECQGYLIPSNILTLQDQNSLFVHIYI